MLLFGMVAATTRKLRVEIWCNQQRLCNWRLGAADTRMHQRSLDVPASVLRGRFLVITFVMRKPVSPKSLGLSSDERCLGIFVQRMALEPIARASGEALSSKTSPADSQCVRSDSKLG